MQIKQKISKLLNLNFLQGAQDLETSIRRFPLSVLSLIVLFIIAVAAIFEVIKFNDTYMSHLVIVTLIGFFWFGATQLFAESHALNKLKTYLISGVGIVFFSILIFSSGQEFPYRFMATILGLGLSVTAAPFLFKRTEESYFWFFNHKVSFGIALSFFASLILFLGAWAAIASVKYLFDLTFSDMDKFIGTLFAFCAILLGPIYALCFIPDRFDDDEKTNEYPKQVGFFANWIMAPLVAVYMVILYAYFAKMLVTQDVPKGLLVYMVSGFAAAGIFTYQLSWPCVKDGKAGKLLNLIHKYFFPALVVPVAMAIYAIGVRVMEYGVTEKRYAVMAIILWLAILSIGFTLKKLQLKHVYIVAAFLLFFASWGPWGMTSVSINSQLSRLDTLLTQNNLIMDGKLIKSADPTEISFDDKKDISAIHQYLNQYQRKNQVKAEGYIKVELNDFSKVYGFDFVSRYESDKKIRENTNNRFTYNFKPNSYNSMIKTSGYDFYLHSLNAYKNYEESKKVHNNLVLARLVKHQLIIDVPEYGQSKINLSTTVEKLFKENPERLKSDDYLILKGAGGKYTIKLEVYTLAGEIQNGEAVVTRINARAFIKLK